MAAIDPSVYLFNEVFDMLNDLIVIDNVDSPEKFDILYSLRYRIFCEESNVIKAEQSIYMKEMDEYDQRSIHCLMLYLPTNIPIGYVRIIMADLINYGNSFPIQIVCNNNIIKNEKMFINSNPVEISRFGFSRQGINEIKEHLYSTVINSNNLKVQRIDSILTTILYLKLQQAVVRTCISNSVTHLFSNTRPQLLRKFTHYGIYFKPIGPINFDGYAFQPCYISLDDMLRHMAIENPTFYKYIIAGTKYENYGHTIEERVLMR